LRHRAQQIGEELAVHFEMTLVLSEIAQLMGLAQDPGRLRAEP